MAAWPPEWIRQALNTVLTTTGDIAYRAASGVTRLAIGSTHHVLTVAGGVPTWAAGSKATLTTTGDMLYASAANTLARLAAGSRGQRIEGRGAATAPAYVWDRMDLLLPAGFTVVRVSPSAHAGTLATGGAGSSRSGTTFSVGTSTAIGPSHRATTTAATTVCGSQAAVFDGAVGAFAHRFTGTAAHSGILGVSGARFFIGAASATPSFTSEVLTSDSPTQFAIGFMVRGATDANYQVVCSNDSGQQFTDTGVPATSAVPLLFRYEITLAGVVTWWIYSNTAGAAASLLASGQFTTTSNPFDTGITAADTGVIAAAKAGSSATYYVENGDCWLTFGTIT